MANQSRMDPVLDLIDEALRRKGLSDAAASKLAVGNYALIKNMRSARSEDKRYNFQSLQKLADVLGLECYFGPPRESGPIEHVTLDGADYAHIPLHDAMLAAGAGCANATEQVIDQLAFRRDWLKKVGVTASTARLARVQGDSMQPTLWPGDMILIDTTRNEPLIRPKDMKDQRRSPAYAVIDKGEARVKRIERPSPDQLMLISDNPDYAPELRQGKDLMDIKIIGKVIWWGHTARE